MRKGNPACVERYRLLKAMAFVLAFVLAAPGIDAVVRYVAGPQRAIAAGAFDRGIDSAALLDAGDAFASLERIEGFSQPANATVPEAFTEEIGFLEGARDVRVSTTGDVVGYVVSFGCKEALARLDESMRNRGWAPVSLGGVEGSSFVKATGSCTWALATCTSAGEGTSVVVRCVYS